MNRILILLILLSLQAKAQSTGSTLVYGRVMSTDKDFNPFSYSGVMHEADYANGAGIFSSAQVDSLGYFQEEFPFHTKISLSTYYEDFYTEDTIIHTGEHKKIEVNFFVRKKIYSYTKEKAQADISNNILQLVIYDSLIYNFNKQLRYTKQFAFDYILVAKPDDYEFDENIQYYNYAMEDHLYSLDSTWHKKVSVIEDSLIHLEADNYGRQHAIDLTSLKVPAKEKLPKKMLEAIEHQKEELDRIFENRKNGLLANTPQFVLKKIDSDKDYQYIFEAEYWLAFNYESMIVELIKRLTNNKEVGLKKTTDLIIMERIQSGDLQFYGHGGIASDDLFKVAGRASHLLKQITGEDFGSVSMYSTNKELKKLQNRWAYWLLQLNNN